MGDNLRRRGFEFYVAVLCFGGRELRGRDHSFAAGRRQPARLPTLQATHRDQHYPFRGFGNCGCRGHAPAIAGRRLPFRRPGSGGPYGKQAKPDCPLSRFGQRTAGGDFKPPGRSRGRSHPSGPPTLSGWSRRMATTTGGVRRILKKTTPSQSRPSSACGVKATSPIAT